MRKNVLTVFTNPLDAEAKHTEKFKNGKGTFTCWQTWSGTKQNRTGTGKTKDSYDNTYANVRVRVKMEKKSYNPNTYSEKRCRKTDTVAKAEKKGNIEYIVTTHWITNKANADSNEAIGYWESGRVTPGCSSN